MTPDQIAQRKLLDIHQECNRHLHHVFLAMQDIAPHIPFQAEWLDTRTDSDIRAIDQFIYRFTKLQDTIGRRLLPAILDLLDEPHEDWSMMDRLNRLEKLGYFNDSRQWRISRQVRNRLSHEYPGDKELLAEILNQTWQALFSMYYQFRGISARLKEASVVTGDTLFVEPLPEELASNV